MRYGPLPGPSDVIDLNTDFRQSPMQILPVQMGFSLFEKGGIVRTVTITNGCLPFGRCRQMFSPKLSQELVDVVSACLIGLDERFVDQRHQVLQICAGNLFCRLPGKAPSKNGQLLKDVFIMISQEILHRVIPATSTEPTAIGVSRSPN